MANIKQIQVGSTTYNIKDETARNDINTLSANVGTLNSLDTTDKTSLVEAVNEVVGSINTLNITVNNMSGGTNSTDDFEINNWKQRIIDEQLKNDFAWKTFNKAYITFVFDDCLTDIDLAEEIFNDFNLPCCFAVIPANVTRILTGTGNNESAQTVLARAQNNGFEILAHSTDIISSSSTDAVYIEKIITPKRELEAYGFEVNGIIQSGNGGDEMTADFNKCVKMMRPYYRYSDRYGYNTGVVQYDHERSWISDTLAANQTKIDNAITNNSWLVLSSHRVDSATADSLNTTEEMLRDILTYIQGKGEQVEVVTYKTLHDTMGSTVLEQRIAALENA